MQGSAGAEEPGRRAGGWSPGPSEPEPGRGWGQPTFKQEAGRSLAPPGQKKGRSWGSGLHARPSFLKSCSTDLLISRCCLRSPLLLESLHLMGPPLPTLPVPPPAPHCRPFIRSPLRSRSQLRWHLSFYVCLCLKILFICS